MGDHNIGELTELGLALESNWGTAIATVTKGILANAFSANPVTTAERVPEMDGSLVRSRSSAGGINFEPSFTFFLDPGDTTGASVGEILASIFGQDTVTGSTDPFTHTFAAAQNAEPPSFTLYRKTGTLIKTYAGFRAGSIKFSLTANDPRIPVEVTGIAKVEADIGAKTLTFSDEALLVPSQVAFNIDDAANNDMESIEITFTRNLEGVHTLSSSRNINRLPSGDFLIDIVMNGIEASAETLRDKFLALHDGSTEQFDIDLNIIRTASRKLEIDIPKAFFVSHEGPDVSEGLNRISMTGAALRDSGLQVLLLNAVSGAYDA